MPLILKPADLAEGMVLKDPVRRGSATLLPGGKTLTAFDIQTLQRKWPQTLVYIVDARIDDVANLDEPIDYEANETLLGYGMQAAQLLTRAWAKGEVTGQQADQLKVIVQKAFDFLKFHPIHRAVPKAAYKPAEYLTDHVARTFYYALLLSEQARPWVMRERKRYSSASGLSDYVAGDMLPLGMGALLMDAGMSQIKGLEVAGPVGAIKQKAVLEHTQASVDLMPPGMPTLVKTVVATHHENLDGSGYPARQSRDRVHMFSRIVRIADSFDAATTPRAWRSAKTSVEVLWEMAPGGPRAGHYDQDLVGMFLQLVTPFPIGTLIQMQDGYFAAVVGQSRDPFRPRVAMLMDPKRQRISSSEIDQSIDLSNPRAPRMGAVHGESLAFLYDGNKPKRSVA